jgi:GNAT superfamily N-acetyltransferase
VIEESREGYLLSADKALLDLPLIHQWLSTDAYWAMGRSLDVVARSFDESVSLGAYAEATGAQVAVARAVTDRSVFAYLCDVYVDAEHRGRGLGRWMVRAFLDSDELLGTVGRVLLATQDAHGVYREVGFDRLEDPTIWMELRRRQP